VNDEKGDLLLLRLQHKAGERPLQSVSDSSGLLSLWKGSGGEMKILPGAIREVMDIYQAAEYLGVSPDTMYRYASEKKIPAFKLGNRWRFRRVTLDRWMQQMEEGNAHTQLHDKD